MTSPTPNVTVCLPISDRHRAMAFYRAAFNFEPVGPLAEDGIPEPLQFKVAEGMLLMLIPSGGFGWVLGDREIAQPGTNECIMSLTLDTDAEVDELVERIRTAGGEISSEPEAKAWGYSALCTDVDGHAWQLTAA